VDHLLLLQKSVPIRQLPAEYMAEKANDTELSATYHSDLRLRFGRFCRTFGETGTREITAQQIKEWLWSLKTPEGRPQSAQSKKTSRLGSWRCLATEFSAAGWTQTCANTSR
jgi:hypothetical protein